MELSSLLISVVMVFVVFVQQIFGVIVASSGDWESDCLGVYGMVLVGDQHGKSASTEEYDPFVHKRYQLECIEETRVDPDLVMKIKNGNFEPKPDVLLKLWVLCTMMKSGLMTAQGVYKYDTAMARVAKTDAAFVGRIIDRCLSRKAIPPVDIAYNFVRCYSMRKGNYSAVTVA